jgi:hypothetical protein
MRKKVLLLLVLALVVGAITPVATAAVKPGAKCTKQGQISTTAGKKYTCVKSGKKLVWNKGVAVKAAARPDLNPVLKPAEPTPTPTPTPSIDRKDWELIYLKIWDEFEKSQNQGSFPFDYKLGPTVNQDKARESIAAYDKAMKPWLAILDGAKVSPVIWTIMSEKDYAWWKQVVEQQESTAPNYAWNPVSNMLGHCQLSSNAFCGYGATYKSNTPEYKFLQYNVIGSNYSQSPNGNTVNHESVHFYQLSVVQGFPRDLPCWYVEGQASLYGNALEHNLTSQRSSSIRQRDNFKGIVRQYQPSADSFTTKNWTEILKNMYQPHISCSSQQDYFKYAVGMFAWEHLYEKFGPKVMHQVLLDFKEGKSFDQASQARLGLNLEELNEKLATHFVDVFAGGN